MKADEMIKEGARIDLKVLVKKGLFEIKGKGRSVYYVLK